MNPPDQALLQIFAAEQAEHVQRMRLVIAGLAEPTADPPAIEELLRHAHTLKGASRAAGFDPTETLTHAMEGVLAGLCSGQVGFNSSLRALFFRVLDTIEDILTAVLSRRAVPDRRSARRNRGDSWGEAGNRSGSVGGRSRKPRSPSRAPVHRGLDARR